MAVSLIRGSTQILAASISVDRLVAGWDSTIIRSTGGVAMAADWSMGNNLITNVKDAVSAQDAINLRVMQSYINGIAIKPAVRGVMDTNRALTGACTDDGITYATGDVILLVAQSTPAQMGPWVVNTAGAWTRPTWWAAASVQKPALFFVTEGDDYEDTKWTTVTDGDITVDTTSISILQDTSGGSYTAGDGLSLTGSDFDINVGNGIEISSDAVRAKHDTSRLVTVDGSGIGITDGAAGQLILGAVSTGKASWQTMSGDVTIAAGGAATVNHTAGSGFLKYTDIVYNETPSGSVNGSNTAFGLAATPVNSSLKLYVNGVLQEPGGSNDYTISTATITMLYALQTGDKIRAYYAK